MTEHEEFLNAVINARGYLVAHSIYELELRREFHLMSQKTGQIVEQRFCVLSRTNKADYDAQEAIMVQFGRTLVHCRESDYFYRVVTD